MSVGMHSYINYLQAVFCFDLSITQKVVANDATIVKAIIGLARGLNLTSIAEGVETEQQLNFLRQNGCDQVQGYLINRPVPAEQMEQLLRAEQSSDEKRPLPMLKPELKRANNR